MQFENGTLSMNLNECLPFLGKGIIEQFEKHASPKSFRADDIVIKQGQNLRFLPIVINGSVKVYSDEEDTQFLLYYVTAGETCIFSFAHIFHEEQMGFSAVAETDSELLLLPIDKVREWFAKYPHFSHLLLKGYQKHYDDLLQTTKQIICNNLEERLLTYLYTKADITKSSLLKISHQDIALDLGTSREVISRLMKKRSVLEKVVQEGRKIKVL